MACRESNPSSFICTKDDGDKIIVVKGRSNGQGKFLRILEILIPWDKDYSGWVNVSYILRRSFEGESPIAPQVPIKTNEGFPALLDAVGAQLLMENRSYPLGL